MLPGTAIHIRWLVAGLCMTATCLELVAAAAPGVYASVAVTAVVVSAHISSLVVLAAVAAAAAAAADSMLDCILSSVRVLPLVQGEPKAAGWQAVALSRAVVGRVPASVLRWVGLDRQRYIQQVLHTLLLRWRYPPVTVGTVPSVVAAVGAAMEPQTASAWVQTGEASAGS